VINGQFTSGTATAKSKGVMTRLISLIHALALALSISPSLAAYTDAEIEGAVERRLGRDPAIFNYDIAVAVNDGVVTLTGTVRNLLERLRSTKIATSRKGVRTVVNTLTVAASTRSADEIQADVQTALTNTPALAKQAMKVDVSNSMVRLTGEVSLYNLIDVATNVAASVYGVTGVRNELAMSREVDTRADEEIASHISKRFQSDIWLNSFFIGVAVKEGEATLSGSVDSEDQRARATSKAWVSGVKAVKASSLKIDTLSDDGSRRKPVSGAALSDAEILAAIQDGLATHPWVLGQNVSVEVIDRSATLSGKVNYPAAKTAAGLVARNTTGVRQVLNQILIAPELTIADDKILITIKQGWSSNPYTRVHHIKASVEDGMVTLTGLMPSSFERHQASVTAANVYGVRDIDNQIQVDRIRRGYHPSELNEIMMPFPPPSEVLEHLKSDAEIKAAIEDELKWSWFVDGEQVSVTVAGGMAKLEGSVSSECAMKAAIRAAADGGAGSVVNELKLNVKP
jgi:osmotically-inducible protein OsmY